MNSADKPFVMIGGQTEQVAIRNRIMAIDRINYLIGDKFDLRNKTTEYRYLLDMEMYQRWYKNEPKDKKIDEEYCQRASEVIRALEKDAFEIEKALTGVKERVKQAFKSHDSLPLKKEEEPCKSETYQDKKEKSLKKGFIQSFLRKLRRKEGTEKHTLT